MSCQKLVEQASLNFDDLYRMHLENLGYMAFWGKSQSFPYGDEFLAIISACLRSRTLILRLQSYYYYDRELAQHLFGECFFWSRGYRLVLMRWNPFAAAAHCKDPFDFYQMMVSLELSPLPDGIHIT